MQTHNDASHSVIISGCGLTTARGKGCQANIAALRSAQAAYKTIRINTLNEPIAHLPFLSAGDLPDLDAYTNSSADQFETMIKPAIDEAIAMAGLQEQQLERMPIFLGSSSFNIDQAEQSFGHNLLSDENALPLPVAGYQKMANAITEHYPPLNGQYFTFNTACSAAANGILQAKRYIEAGKCARALVIGFEKFNQTTSTGFFGMQLLCEDVMRPFDARRNGLVLGDGCGVLILEASEAKTGISVKGGASSCDIHSISASNPDGSAIASVLNSALNDAGIGAMDIAAIKAHGTASPLNDDGEAEGMKKVFRVQDGEHSKEKLPAFFCLKPYIGHTLGACGAIETILTIEALKQGFIPASPGFEQEDPALQVSPTRSAQTTDSKGHYMLNYFGFGGNNCSIILEQR